MFEGVVWARINNRRVDGEALPIRKHPQQSECEGKAVRVAFGAIGGAGGLSSGLASRDTGDQPSLARSSGERIGCIDVLHGSRRAALRERGCRGFRDDEGGTVEQDRQAYIEKLKAQMDQWDAEIDKLEAKAREAQADQRIRYEEAVQDMHQRRDEAQKMLKRVQEASAASWKDLRTGFDAAWSDVSKAMDRAMARWR